MRIFWYYMLGNMQACLPAHLFLPRTFSTELMAVSPLDRSYDSG